MSVATTIVPRSVRRSRDASARRIALLKKLSPDGRRSCCGAKRAHADLEVDHPAGRLWLSNRIASHARVARYEREHAAGVELRAICRDCSARQGGRRYHGQARDLPG